MPLALRYAAQNRTSTRRPPKTYALFRGAGRRQTTLHKNKRPLLHEVAKLAVKISLLMVISRPGPQISQPCPCAFNIVIYLYFLTRSYLDNSRAAQGLFNFRKAGSLLLVIPHSSVCR